MAQYEPILPPETFAERVLRARRFADLDQDELAERIGCARQTISNYETGATRPNRVMLRQLALACGVDQDWLAHGTETVGSQFGAPDLPVCDRELALA